MDNICKICNQELDKKHPYSAHKIKYADYMEKYYPRFDLFTKELIRFKSEDSYFLTDFNDKRNLKKYLELISKEEGLEYLKNWLIRRRESKELRYSPSEFELRSLIFPPINYIKSYYGENSYQEICVLAGFQPRYGYDNPPEINENKILNLICDSREQNILKFPNMQIGALNFGDYTIQDSWVFVERKSLPDAISTLSQGYDRFKKEIQRCADANKYLIILIEEKYSNLQSFEYMPHIHSKCNWSFISHRIRELILKYPHTIQFLAVDGRIEAKRIIEKIFKLENINSYDLQYWYNKGEL